MKQTQTVLTDQIKSKNKLIVLIAVVCIALLVLIFSGYRLLSYDPGAKHGDAETQLINSIQNAVNQVPPQILSKDILINQARNNLNRSLASLNTDWPELKSFDYFSDASISRTERSVNDLIQYIQSYLGGRVPNEDIFSVTNRVLSDTEALRPEILAIEEQDLVKTEVYFVALSIFVVVVALVFICLIIWYDMSKFGVMAKEQSESSQAAILRLLDELADLADGDLTVSATVTEDFTGAIADSINFTIDQLRQLVSRINNTSVQVSKAAQSSRQTALHLAEASDHQAQEIAGASAAINEMAVTIDQVSANASESALVAGKSVSIANNGAKLVQNTIQGMDTIREQIQDTSKRIKRLGESSQEIGDIVSLINDIADQTNILALNAAIQASMAGDAGRGFAVVADEVQRLAERSAAATKQIETLVNTIQTDTNEAVISMEQTTSEVVKGARLAQDAGVALEEIEGVSVNLAELIQNISNAARQQASSAGHISNTMNVIQEITSQTSSGTSATAESIAELASMALELRESVSDFTLPAHMAVDEDMLGINSRFGSPQGSVPDALNDINLDDDDADDMFELPEDGGSPPRLSANK